MWKQRAPPNFEGGNAHPSHAYLSRVWWNKKHNWFQKFRYSSLSYIVLASTLQLPCSYLASFCTFSPLHLHQAYVIFNASSPYCIISSFYLLFLASFLFFTFCSLHLLFIASLLGLILIAFSLLHLLIIASYFQCIFSSSLYCISITASPLQHLFNASFPQCIFSWMHFVLDASSLQCILYLLHLLSITST